MIKQRRRTFGTDRPQSGAGQRCSASTGAKGLQERLLKYLTAPAGSGLNTVLTWTPVHLPVSSFLQVLHHAMTWRQLGRAALSPYGICTVLVLLGDSLKCLTSTYEDVSLLCLWRQGPHLRCPSVVLVFRQ